MENLQKKEFYDFGEFRLDSGNRLLWHGGKAVPLTVREFEVLFFFVRHAGSVVEKEALLNAVWKDTFVEEATMMQNISRLRRKLEEANGSGEKFIETLPKRGYRFLPAVVKTDDAVLLIEEHTVQHIRVEERIEILPASINDRGAAIKEDFLEIADYQVPAAASNLLPAAAKSRFSYLWFIFGFFIFAAIGFAVYRGYFYDSAPVTILVSRIKPFAGLPGRESQPAFSPDGKMLAFVWNGGEQGDNSDVYVKLTGAAGEPVRLTRDQTDEVSPTFSPDGKTIAFVRVLPNRGEVFLVPALGGAERKICDVRRGFSTISFSPDGKLLAVYGDDGSGHAGIFTVNIETGEKKRVTMPPELAADDQPAFAPDGSSIAFIRSYPNGGREIFIAATATAGGTPPRQLTFDEVWIGGMAWSADSRRIIFSSRRKHNGRANLWQIEAAGGGSGGEQPRPIAVSGENLSGVAVSPDNRTTAFVKESNETHIRHVDLTKPVGTNISAGKFAPSSLSDNSPNFSPDGRQVVFASNRTGKYEIWIAGADGSNVRQLTDFQVKSSAGSPRFSPDGKSIVFDAQVEGNGDIYIVPANGGAMRRVTDAAAFDYVPSWSADGSAIYFASNRSGKAQIYKIPAAGGETRQITKNGGGDSFESPDGKYLYYRKGKGSTALWRIPSEGGGEEESLPELAEAGYWRSWSMIKAGIYFVRRAEAPPYKIMFYDFSSGQVTETAAVEPSPIWTYSGLAVSEDGKQILYAQTDQSTSSIMLAEIGN